MTTSVEVQAPAAPVEVVTPIKPSEALRLGRLHRPRHAPGQYLAEQDGACAIGAMAEGWDISIPEVEDRLYDLLDDEDADADVIDLFDVAEQNGRDGDAGVIEYLESRGL